MEVFIAARRAVTSACRGLVKTARIVTPLLFFPLLILFLRMINPGPQITGALKVPGRTAFMVVIIISLVAAVDSFLSIVASYRRLAGFPWWESLDFAAGSLNIVMACHWLLTLPSST
ncbi:MAG: hypothetical protein ABSG19_14280 [Candidatus Aminicenantales bacterium]